MSTYVKILEEDMNMESGIAENLTVLTKYLKNIESDEAQL